LAVWIVLLGGYPLLMVLAQESLNPTAQDRLSFVATTNASSAFLMLEGPAYGDSAGALGLWAAGDAFWIVGLVSLLIVIRHTRSEEETGRRELLGATVVGRHANLAAALTVTMAASSAVGLVAALALIGRGLPATGAVALGLSFAVTGWMFAAVAAVAAQLTESAAAANGIAGVGLGAAWLLRAAGDAGGPNGGTAWLSWLSPIGWARRIQPFGGERWWIMGLALFLAVVGTVSAVALASRRDVGAGMMRPRLGPANASSGLHRGPLLGWAVGFALLAGMLSGAAKSSADLFETNPGVGDMFKLVGGGSDPSDVYLSAILGMIGLIAAAYAIQGVLRMHSEEDALRAEPVLATGGRTAAVGSEPPDLRAVGHDPRDGGSRRNCRTGLRPERRGPSGPVAASAGGRDGAVARYLAI
jgi:ABC-2 type transport system permease protein